MKWILISAFLIANPLMAQVMGTPISITDEGVGQKPGEDPEVARARSELKASKVRPSSKDELEVAEDQSPDGSISGEKMGPAPVKKEAIEAVAKEESEAKEEIKEETKLADVPAKKNPLSWKRINFFAAPRWLRLNVGRMWSSWSDVAPELEDGSLVTGLRLVQPIDQTRFSLAFGIDFVHGSGDSFNAENIRSTQFVLEPEYTHSLNETFSLVGGLSLVYADSNIRKMTANNDQHITYNKYGSGSTFGLIPALGIRARPTPGFSLDLIPGYALYFASPYDEMGGLSLKLRFNFAL